MGILSMVGVFYLFGAATGLIQFSQKNGEQDLAHSFMDCSLKERLFPMRAARSFMPIRLMP